MKSGIIGTCVGAAALIVATVAFAWTYYEIKVSKNQHSSVAVQQSSSPATQDSTITALNERIAALEKRVEELSVYANTPASKPKVVEGESEASDKKLILIEEQVKKLKEEIEQIGNIRNSTAESSVTASPVFKEQVKQAIDELKEETEKKKVSEEKERYRNKLIKAREALLLNNNRLDGNATELGLTAQQLDDVRLVLIDWIDAQLQAIDSLSEKPTKEELEQKKRELDTQLDTELQKILSVEQMEIVHKKFPNGYVGHAIK